MPTSGICSTSTDSLYSGGLFHRVTVRSTVAARLSFAMPCQAGMVAQGSTANTCGNMMYMRHVVRHALAENQMPEIVVWLTVMVTKPYSDLSNHIPYSDLSNTTCMKHAARGRLIAK